MNPSPSRRCARARRSGAGSRRRSSIRSCGKQGTDAAMQRRLREDQARRHLPMQNACRNEAVRFHGEVAELGQRLAQLQRGRSLLDAGADRSGPQRDAGTVPRCRPATLRGAPGPRRSMATVRRPPACATASTPRALGPEPPLTVPAGAPAAGGATPPAFERGSMAAVGGWGLRVGLTARERCAYPMLRDTTYARANGSHHSVGVVQW